MRGHQQIENQSRRGTEAGFTRMAMDTRSPWIDRPPRLVPGQPELCEFRVRYFDDDKP